MQSFEVVHTLITAIVVLSILLMLVRPRNIPEVYWVGSGVLSLLVLRLVPLRLAGGAVAKGLDVYLFLVGMMLLSELAREQGLFDWLASAALEHARGSALRLFILIYAIGALVTIFLSNDATAVVLTPAILVAVRKAKAAPLPYLFACALIANAASFVLPISNPANLVVFHHGMPPLSRWLLSFAAPSVLSIVTTCLVLRRIFARQLSIRIEDGLATESLSANGKIVLAGLALTVAALLTASSLKRDLGLPTCLAALAVTAVVSLKTRSSPLKLAKGISWSTITLVAGLFVMVDAMQSIGVLRWTVTALEGARQLPPAVGALLVGFFAGTANNLVNNLPLGLIAGAALQSAHVQGLIANAVLIGVDLGPNLSITGSLATILWLLALRREGLDISFRDFLKVGVIVMPLALLAALMTLIAAAILMPLLLGAQ